MSTLVTLTLPPDCINPATPTHWKFALRMSLPWIAKLQFFLSTPDYQISPELGWAAHQDTSDPTSRRKAEIVFSGINEALTSLTSEQPDLELVENISAQARPTIQPSPVFAEYDEEGNGIGETTGYTITAYFSDTLIDHILNPPNAQLAAMANGITLELP